MFTVDVKQQYNNNNDPTETILTILYGEVPHMLPAKYQPNPPGGSGEEDF